MMFYGLAAHPGSLNSIMREINGVNINWYGVNGLFYPLWVLFFSFFIGVLLFYTVVLVSDVQQRNIWIYLNI